MNEGRRISLDQFRGYTVVGMLAVNFFGDFQWVSVHSPILQHYQSYFSYADAIMPQFFFAAGYAYRFTFLRRLKTSGVRDACMKTLRRNLGLIMLGIIIYGLDVHSKNWAELSALGWAGFFTTAFQREPFQTLVHMGLAALWILPVIGRSLRVQVIYAVFSIGIFYFLSQSFYYDWEMKRPVIDGGPLGFLSWSIPMLAGSWAHDFVEADDEKRLLLIGTGLALLGLTLSCLPGGIWSMSQRAATAPYQIFGAGISFLTYAFFFQICDIRKWESGFLKTFGVNALAAYILDGPISEVISRWAPSDSSLPRILLTLTAHIGTCWILLRGMEKRKIFLRF